MAVSEDGGETFGNFKVSETPFTPFNSVFYGHYIGLTAHDDHVLPVWMRMDDGFTSIPRKQSESLYCFFSYLYRTRFQKEVYNVEI